MVNLTLSVPFDRSDTSYLRHMIITPITPFGTFKPSVNLRNQGEWMSNCHSFWPHRADYQDPELPSLFRYMVPHLHSHSSHYWKEGHEQPKVIVYTIVAKPYVKITQRIELRPPNPSSDIGITMIEDSAISITYNLRLLFNPSYTVPTIDPTLTGTLCRRCGTCPLQTSPHYQFQTQLVHDRCEYLLPLPVTRVVWI